MSLRYAETSETAFSSNPVQILNFYCPKHPFRGTVCKTVCLMLPDRCPVCHVFLSVLSVTLVHCIMDGSRRNLARTVGLGPGHIVLDGDPAPHKRGTAAPTILAHVCCGQSAGWTKMPLGMEVGLGPGHILLDVDPAAPKGHSPQFSAHVCCGRTAGWIKVPLGTKVGLGPGHIVLDGDPAPPMKRGHGPQFSVHVYCGQTVADLSYC